MVPDSTRTLSQRLADPATQREAFGEMVAQYSERLYWVVRRIVLTHDNANDALQNTFLKAWDRLDDFRGQAQPYSWLYRIAVNEAIDSLRRERNSLMVSADEGEGVAATLLADEYFDGDRMQALLQQAVASLPEVQRAVFTMRYYDEMKYAYMSEVLSTSEGALKASYHIAVKKITEYMKRKGATF